MATADCPSSATGRLFLTDRASKVQFLINTGSDLSVYPQSLLRDRRDKTDYNLCAANGSIIATYYGFVHFNLGLACEDCLICDVL